MEAAKFELAQRDAAADDEKASKVAIRERLQPRMDAWQKGKQVRACSLRRLSPSRVVSGITGRLRQYVSSMQMCACGHRRASWHGTHCYCTSVGPNVRAELQARV